MIWSGDSNRFCCLPYFSKGTNSRAGKDVVSLAAMNGVTTNTGPLHKSELCQTVQSTGSTGLHSSAGCAGKSGLYLSFDPFLCVHRCNRGQGSGPYTVPLQSGLPHFSANNLHVHIRVTQLTQDHLPVLKPNLPCHIK